MQTRTLISFLLVSLAAYVHAAPLPQPQLPAGATFSNGLKGVRKFASDLISAAHAGLPPIPGPAGKVGTAGSVVDGVSN
ncbi:hypothetical protein BKA70DRAFT_1306213 [Coprinopsis sp. MPI-PUGE-AT-0042]|nr:hypothetical protein BKA70DRAFT_1306213 [Coprinopsis sp. MPI-PUGE-AT-0042]